MEAIWRKFQIIFSALGNVNTKRLRKISLPFPLNTAQKHHTCRVLSAYHYCLPELIPSLGLLKSRVRLLKEKFWRCYPFPYCIKFKIFGKKIINPTTTATKADSKTAAAATSFVSPAQKKKFGGGEKNLFFFC